MLQKLFEKFQETYKPFDASLGTFYAPDIKELEKILEINELGQEYGQNNRPAPNAKKKDSVSRSIDHAMNVIISEGRQELLNYASGASGLTSGQSSSVVQHADKITKETFSKLQEKAKTGVIELFPLKSDIIRGESYLNQFREENGITRPSVTPDSISSGWGLIAIAALGETILNALTLKDAHKDGLIGVGLEVLLFTAVNIGIACILGAAVLRLLNHISIAKKVIGAFGGLFLLSLIGVINLSFAHYRDALMLFSKVGKSDAQFIEQATLVMGDAIQNMLASPLMLSDGKSYLLFFIGCLLAFFATYKSYGLYDPYPGYGRLDRLQKDSHEDYLLTVEEFFEDLGVIAEDGIKELEGISHTSEGAKAQIQQREIILQKLEERFRAWLMIIDTCGKTLYSQYREVNEQYRSKPAPPCFDIEYAVPEEAYKLPKLSSRPKKSGATINNRKRINTIYAALSDYQGHFKVLEDLSPEGRLLDSTNKKFSEIDKISKKYSK